MSQPRGHDEAWLADELARMPDARLHRMAEAGHTCLNCLRALQKAEMTPLDAVLDRASERPEPWQHYPPGEAHDPEHHSRYYFHVHEGTGTPARELGHFHTFLDRAAIDTRLHPVARVTRLGEAETGHRRDANPATARADAAGLVHLAAISLSIEGLPCRLFATNRWVTGGAWYEAAAVQAWVPRFRIDHAWPSWPLNLLLSGLFVLFRPQIERLIVMRDAQLEKLARLEDTTLAALLDDRRHEVLASLDIDLHRQIPAIAAELSRRG